MQIFCDFFHTNTNDNYNGLKSQQAYVELSAWNFAVCLLVMEQFLKIMEEQTPSNEVEIDAEKLKFYKS